MQTNHPDLPRGFLGTPGLGAARRTSQLHASIACAGAASCEPCMQAGGGEAPGALRNLRATGGSWWTHLFSATRICSSSRPAWHLVSSSAV